MGLKQGELISLQWDLTVSLYAVNHEKRKVCGTSQTQGFPKAQNALWRDIYASDPWERLFQLGAPWGRLPLSFPMEGWLSKHGTYTKPSTSEKALFMASQAPPWQVSYQLSEPGPSTLPWPRQSSVQGLRGAQVSAPSTCARPPGERRHRPPLSSSNPLHPASYPLSHSYLPLYSLPLGMLHTFLILATTPKGWLQSCFMHVETASADRKRSCLGLSNRALSTMPCCLLERQEPVKKVPKQACLTFQEIDCWVGESGGHTHKSSHLGLGNWAGVRPGSRTSTEGAGWPSAGSWGLARQHTVAAAGAPRAEAGQDAGSSLPQSQGLTGCSALAAGLRGKTYTLKHK